MIKLHFMACCDRCDRNWLKPLFTAIKHANIARKKKDFSYVLPIPFTAESKRLNYLTIALHSVSLTLCLADFTILNILSSNRLFPLWTLPLGNVLNCFALTLSFYFVMMLSVHISLFSPFLTRSKIRYLEKSHFISLFKSMLSKSIIFPVLFSLSPVLMLNTMLWLFILGNSPRLYFKPNLVAFHDFHLHLDQRVVPRLLRRFRGYKSREWVLEFVYLLFNAVILDEYIMKKNSPHRTRVSFIGMLGGDDAGKVLKRVNKDLDAMHVTLSQNKSLDRGLLDLNAKSWDDAAGDPETENVDESVSEITDHLKYLIVVLYPFHILLFWIYILFNCNDSFTVNLWYIVAMAVIQCVFCAVSSYHSPFHFIHCFDSQCFELWRLSVL